MMLISKFHKLVHDKTFWAIMTILICIAFVGLYIPGQKGKRATRKAQTAGKLYGKPVLYPEFAKMRSDAYLTLSLSMGRKLPSDDGTRELLDRTAWSRLAALKKAQKLGITASNAEMLQMIRSLPFFNDQQGQFNPQAYKYFTANILPSFGYTARQFEEVYRDETILRKVAFLPMQAALVTPEELKDAFHSLNDTFMLQYVELTDDLVKDSVTVSDEDAKAFYDANSSYFATPEKVRVKYAEFPVADYMDQIIVTDADAQAYYDQNLADYITKEATTNAPAEYKSFEEVKADVMAEVKEIGARRKAMEAATEMVIDLTPARDGSKTPTFEEAAKEMQAAVKFAPDFAVTETADKIDAGREFTRAAFALEDTPANYYSDAIVGKDYVYVIGLVRRLPSIIPEFDLVKKEATELARNRAIRTALGDKAAELREAAAAEGADFKTVMKTAGAKVQTTPEFSLSEGLKDNAYANLLSSAAVSLQTGEVSAPLATQNDSILLAQLTERTAADEAALEDQREGLVSLIENQRLQTIMSSWQKNILTEANFKDMMPKGN